jgi:hypothetical protein
LTSRLRAARGQVFEKAETRCGAPAGTRPQRQPDEVSLHLSGDSLQQFQPFLLFGSCAGRVGASLLREIQLSLEPGQILLLPHIQNTLRPSGGAHGKSLHTLVCLSARWGDFSEKSGIFRRNVTVNYRKL